MTAAFKAALILTGVDKATEVVNRVASKIEARVKQIQERTKLGRDLMGMGRDIAAYGVAAGLALAPAIKAYSTLEDAQAGLRAVMMQDGGRVDETMMAKLSEKAVELGNRLPGTTAELTDMFRVMRENNVEAERIVGGLGQATAYFAVASKMSYGEAAQYVARLSDKLNIADKDAEGFLDVINRARQLGVETGEMGYFFSRAAGGLKAMGVQGLDSMKQLAPLGAMLIKMTGSGETAGTALGSMLLKFADPVALQKTQAAAAKLGVSLNLMENGKFVGITRMVGELGKLKGMGTQEAFGVVDALTGGSGQDAAALIAMINAGADGYNEVVMQMASRAKMVQQVEGQLGTMAALWEAATGTFENAMAAFAAGMAPELKALTTWMGEMAAAVTGFFQANPKLAKAIGLTIGIFAALAVVIGGVVALAGAVAFAIANPIILIAGAVAAAIALVVTFWDEISGFFSRLYNWFENSGPLVKILLYPITALWLAFKVGKYAIGLLIDNWDLLMAAFGHIWDAVTLPIRAIWWMIQQVFGAFNSLDQTLKEAGMNIMRSIWEGMKAMASKPVEMIAEVAQKIRAYLPFSPAKMGALRDIHRIKLVETVASAIQPGPMVNAMARATAATANVLPQAPAGLGAPIAGASSPNSGGGFSAGQISVSYAPNITIGPGGAMSKDDVLNVLRQHAGELGRIIAEANRTASRRSFE